MNRPYKVYAGPYRAPSFGTRAAAFRHAQKRADEGPGTGYVKSERFFSRTTSAHVREFLRGNMGTTVDHDTILKLAQEAR